MIFIEINLQIIRVSFRGLKNVVLTFQRLDLLQGSPPLSLFSSHRPWPASPTDFSTRPRGWPAKVLLRPQECCQLAAGRKRWYSLPPSTLRRKRGKLWMAVLGGARGLASSGCCSLAFQKAESWEEILPGKVTAKLSSFTFVFFIN